MKYIIIIITVIIIIIIIITIIIIIVFLVYPLKHIYISRTGVLLLFFQMSFCFLSWVLKVNIYSIYPFMSWLDEYIFSALALQSNVL